MPSDGLTFYYGAFSHPKGEVYPEKIEYRHVTSQQGQRWGTIVRYKVAGSFVGQEPELSEDEVNERIEELDDAYQFDYQDCGFLLTDGSPSQHVMLTNDSFNLSGNKVVGRSWDNSTPTELANTRSFSITIEALFLASYDNILHFTETTQRIGNGGPKWQMSNTWNGTPIRENITTQTKVTHVTRGLIVGVGGWPLPPEPLWPLEEQGWRREVTQTSPRYHGNYNKGTHYATSYAYFFERLGPDPTTPSNTIF